MSQEARVQSLMRGMVHYAISARVSFFKSLTSQLAGEDNSNPKLYLWVVTKTLNLDLYGKKT